ncbi:MAG: small-conductance mechanosensitive ion channel [Gemmatimonadetes bacterium]|nr:MAG: small-conductance mechanosensitive ion channel [Gemmatimonadota bacterium]
MLLQTATQAPVQTVPVQTTVVRPSFTDTLMASFRDALSMVLSAIPRILGFIIIVAIGWFVSSLLARAVIGLLRAIRFDELMQRSGLAEFTNKMGTGLDSAGIIAGLVKWLTRIVVLLVAFDVLGLPAVSDVMRQLLLWLPNLVVAIFVLFIGGIAARALGNVIRGATAEAGFANPETLANVVRTTVWAFAIVVAINQLGIATNLITTLFTGFVSALAIALGLAFGLGGRDLASRTLENWYDQAQEGKPRRKARTDE